MNKEMIGKYIAVLGVLFFWAPVWGIVDSYLIMSSSFQEITLFGANEPKISQEEMSSAAFSTAVGFFLTFVALCLLIFSAMGLNYRAKWVYWALIMYSTLLLFIFPVGTLLGVIVLITLVLNRKKFGLEARIT